MMEVYDRTADEELPDLPAWVPLVCRHRAHFANVALLFGEPPLAPAFVVGHASQGPFWLSAYKVRLCGSSGSASSTDTNPPVMPRSHHFYNISKMTWNSQLGL